MKLARWGWLVLAMVGCGSSSGGGTTGPSSTPPPPSPATTVMVGANGMTTFTPQTVTISAGGMVTWQWLGGPHTVTSGAPGAVDGKFCSLMSGTLNPTSCNSTNYAQSSGTYSHTFATAGTYPYFCEVHGAMMTGTVVVGASSGGGGGGGGSGGGSGGGY
jgi:plastocyanin